MCSGFNSTVSFNALSKSARRKQCIAVRSPTVLLLIQTLVESLEIFFSVLEWSSCSRNRNLLHVASTCLSPGTVKQKQKKRSFTLLIWFFPRYSWESIPTSTSWETLPGSHVETLPIKEFVLGQLRALSASHSCSHLFSRKVSRPYCGKSVWCAALASTQPFSLGLRSVKTDSCSEVCRIQL